MTEKAKYATGAALRAALEARLKEIAIAEGTELQRLRRQVAFDRFLARLFPASETQWVLKGGYAMELRFQIARATKDLDFTVRTVSGPPGDVLLEYVQETGRRDLKDFFSFRIGDAMTDLDGAPYGGSRYPVDAMGVRLGLKANLATNAPLGCIWKAPQVVGRLAPAAPPTTAPSTAAPVMYTLLALSRAIPKAACAAKYVEYRSADPSGLILVRNAFEK